MKGKLLRTHEGREGEQRKGVVGARQRDSETASIAEFQNSWVGPATFIQ